MVISVCFALSINKRYNTFAKTETKMSLKMASIVFAGGRQRGGEGWWNLTACYLLAAVRWCAANWRHEANPLPTPLEPSAAPARLLITFF